MTDTSSLDVTFQLKVEEMEEQHYIPVQVGLYWSDRDPFALRAEFKDEGSTLSTWHMSRDYVWYATHPSKPGGVQGTKSLFVSDVRFEYVRGVLTLTLDSAHGRAKFLINNTDIPRINEFLKGTYEIIPANWEVPQDVLDTELRDMGLIR